MYIMQDSAVPEDYFNYVKTMSRKKRSLLVVIVSEEKKNVQKQDLEPFVNWAKVRKHLKT